MATGESSLQNITQEIKSRADIVSIVERYVKLRKSGKNYQGICPFHQEKTPSFIVSPDIQIYKCFGCGKGGDVFSFLQEIEGIDFVEARDKLADELGIKIEKGVKPKAISILEEINQIALDFFQEELNLKTGAHARRYLEGRKIRKESISKFGIGFAPGYNSLYKFITTKNHNKYRNAELLSSGLFVDKGSGIRDKFFNRIMFPIRSVGGAVIGFSGRVLPGNDYGPKYMNTPETAVFHKGETLFGIYESKNEIRKSGYCIMCEGQTDVISSHAAGVKNIVAPLGTGLTEKQISLLKNYTNDIVLMFDSDTAGISAVKRAFTLAAAQGMDVYAASPSPYKDIDEMIQKAPESYIELLKKKTDAFTYLLTKEIENKDLSDLEDYNQTRKFINILLSPIKEKQLYSFYSKKAEKITGINNQETLDPAKSVSRNFETKKDIKNHPDNREQYFLAIILKADFTNKLSKLKTSVFQDPLVKEVLNYLKQKPDITLKQLAETEDLSEDAVNLVKTLLLQSDIIMSGNVDTNKELNHIYLLIYRGYMDKRLSNLRTKLVIAENQEDTKSAEELVEKIKKLSNKIKNLKNDKIS